MHKYNSNDGIEYERKMMILNIICISVIVRLIKIIRMIMNDNEWNGNESNKDGSEDNDDKSDRDSNSDSDSDRDRDKSDKSDKSDKNDRDN